MKTIKITDPFKGEMEVQLLAEYRNETGNGTLYRIVRTKSLDYYLQTLSEVAPYQTLTFMPRRLIDDLYWFFN